MQGRHVICKVLFMNVGKRSESIHVHVSNAASILRSCLFSSSSSTATVVSPSSVNSTSKSKSTIITNKDATKKLNKLKVSKKKKIKSNAATTDSEDGSTSTNLSPEAFSSLMKEINEQLRLRIAAKKAASSLADDNNQVVASSNNTDDVNTVIASNDQVIKKRTKKSKANDSVTKGNEASIQLNERGDDKAESNIVDSTTVTTACSVERVDAVATTVTLSTSSTTLQTTPSIIDKVSDTTSSTLSTPPSASPSSAMSSTDTIRLSKYISDTGLCSRRQAEEWITNKRVAINDIKNIITSPSYKLQLTTDKIFLDKQILKHNKKGRSNVFYIQPKLWAVYKLRGELVAVNDEVKNRPVIYDRLKYLIPEMKMPPPSLSSTNSNNSKNNAIPTSVSTNTMNAMPFASAIAAYEREYNRINNIKDDDENNATNNISNTTVNVSSKKNTLKRYNNRDNTTTSDSNSGNTNGSVNNDDDGTNTNNTTNTSSASYLRPVIYQEFNTEGLCLFSNNPILARLLAQQEATIIKTYRIKINGQITESKLFGLKKGMFIEGKRQPSIEIKVESSQNTMSWCILTTYENSSKVIKNCLEYMHFNVVRMICTSFGPYNVKDLNLSLEPSSNGKENVRVVEVKITPDILQLYRNR